MEQLLIVLSSAVQSGLCQVRVGHPTNQTLYISQVQSTWNLSLSYLALANILSLINSMLSVYSPTRPPYIPHLGLPAARSSLFVIKIISKLFKFLQNLSLVYNIVTTKEIAYFYQTKTLTIKYLEKDIKSHIFVKVSDAVFSNNLVSKKSIEDYLFTLYRKLVNQQLTK